MRLILVLFIFVEYIFSNDIYATFYVQPVKKSILSLSSSGIVDEIYVDIGSKVKRGDILLRLKSEDLQANVDIAKATLENAKIQHRFLKDQFERYEKSKNVIDQNTFEKISTQYQSSFYDLKKAESNYQLQKEMLDKSILYSPFDGIITDKFVEVGDGIGAISTRLFVLESTNKKAVIEFDSRYFMDVMVGFKLESTLSKHPIIINKIYPSINEQTKKALAEGEFIESLPSGIFGDGFIKK